MISGVEVIVGSGVEVEVTVGWRVAVGVTVGVGVGVGFWLLKTIFFSDLCPSLL